MTDYFLHVDILVPKGNEDAFERLMRKFLKRGAFRFFNREFDNELVLALKSTAPFRLAPDGCHSVHSNEQTSRKFLSTNNVYHDSRFTLDQDVIRYVHLWSVPTLEDLDLSRRMQFCSEDSLYMLLDEKVAIEQQELIRRVRWIDPPETPNTKHKIVRAVRQLTYKELGKYMLKVRGLIPSLAKRHWYDLGQFQSVTGTLNAITEFW